METDYQPNSCGEPIITCEYTGCGKRILGDTMFVDNDTYRIYDTMECFANAIRGKSSGACSALSREEVNAMLE